MSASTREDRPTIVGGGLAGSLAAIMLARRGLQPTIYERGAAYDKAEATGGRTINLALAARGLVALESAGVRDAIEPLLLPMSGRIVHDASGNVRRLPYGQWPDEKIWSVSRAELNRVLCDVAVSRHGVEYRFGSECVAYDPASGTASFRAASKDAGDSAGNARLPEGERAETTEFDLRSRFLLAADGAGSIVRRTLASHGLLANDEDLLDHGYRELTIPPIGGMVHALDADGLHIWPRGGFMLIALPNTDGSFTATLFLANEGDVSFATVAGDPVEFFEREFADVVGLIPDLDSQMAANPIGVLGTVRCEPWHHDSAGHQCLLFGDAAHAIVPFHGQGLNACFEDCLELDGLVAAAIAEARATSGAPAEAAEAPGRGAALDWAAIAGEFERRRSHNARAIASMALENYVEMRDRVRDEGFDRRKRLAFELERRTNGRFIPRYSMVMFHPEISYAEAERRGRIQSEILRRATAGPADDLDLALELIEREL